MKKILLLVLVGISLMIEIKAQPNYNVSLLDDKLLQNANAVVRENEEIYTILDTGEATYTQHRVVTILNKNGDEYANLYDFYDKFNTITSLSGKIYDKNGKLIRKIKSDEFIDQKYDQAGQLFDDDRIKYCRPLMSLYPFTIEYEIKEKYNGFINCGYWDPVSSFDISVEHSSFKIITPNKLNIRFKKVNYTHNVLLTENDRVKTYTFQLDTFKAIEYENYSPGFSDIAPIVFCIPDYFKIDNQSGSFQSWKSFGTWEFNLCNQPNQLSDKTKSDLINLKKDAIDTIDLIQKTYQYMQSKTRYVGIQLGIGGWKPFDASVVDKYGYSDCKGLANYMKTLLNFLGIDALMALAPAGRNRNDIYWDEAFNQFNHAIVCVPNHGDTIWLECTSQTIPFGYLGTFTDDRHVLLITPGGGKLVKTITYTKDQNSEDNKINCDISHDGDLQASVNRSAHGIFYDLFEHYLYISPKEQKDDLYKEMIFANSTITELGFKAIKNRIPQLNMNFKFSVNKYATKMGSRLFLPLNVLNKKDAIGIGQKVRLSHLQLRHDYTEKDTVVFHLPNNYTLEYIPSPYEVSTPFGSYSEHVTLSEDKTLLTYIRTFTQVKGLYNPEKYKEYVQFINDVSKKDNQKVSLIGIP